MPINQPPNDDDPAMMAWYLEIVRLVNRLEGEINELETRLKKEEEEQKSNEQLLTLLTQSMVANNNYADFRAAVLAGL